MMATKDWRLTGSPGFDLAFQNGRPEDAWAFVDYARRRFPKTPLQVVWLLHVEAFREQGLSPGLIQEPQLSRWFPPALVEAEKKKLPQTPEEAPAGKDLALKRFGDAGVVLRNRYDLEEARGRPLSRAIDYSIETALERYETTTAALYPRSQKYFEKTMGLLDKGRARAAAPAPAGRGARREVEREARGGRRVAEARAEETPLPPPRPQRVVEHRG